ncbi:penicillin-binding protein activator [Massilia sp. S19_KUP03_FR1]|uniref:penicillin-binding protein activator n=1 Tax=Massilia sp. S19_KUP03_FR1 TaxID=3025503 RepID=UPI002FCDD730
MPVNKLASLAAVLASGLLVGCSTPCSAPGGLCAPIETNTRLPPPAPPVLAPIAPPPEAIVTTSPIDVPDAIDAPQPALAPTGQTRIALLLPLNSATLAAAADALRAGFMAAYERDRAGVIIDLVPSDDTLDATLRAYRDAAARNDMVVGPLLRPAVAAVAAGPVTKPTLALNHPGDSTPLPPSMLTIGLTIEDEARQVAAWAHADFPTGRPLVLTGTAAWQRRLASAFHDHWNKLGSTAYQVELALVDGHIADNALAELKVRVDIDAPDFIFAALDPEQLRQVRAALGTSLPAYGTSSVNPGRGAGTSVAELDGVRMLDLPWQVQPDHPAAMAYPRRAGENRSAPDLDRLYALGIDAYRVAREMALHPGQAITLDGVTGQLKIQAQAPRFERSELPVIYRGGLFEAATNTK